MRELDYAKICTDVIPETQNALKKAFSMHGSYGLEIRKKGHGDWVTYGDMEIESDLCGWVRQKFPDHGILSEESSCYGEDRQFIWYIDPIDGTTNYMRANCDYSVSIGLMRENKPVIGVVCGRDELYAAAGSNLVCLKKVSSGADALENAIIGFSPRTAKWMAAKGGDPIGLMAAAAGYRYIGSSALELCRVASGKLDLYFSSNLKPWDHAAAMAVVLAAGAHFSVFNAPETLVMAWRKNAVLEQAVKYFPREIQALIQVLTEETECWK